MPDPVEGDGRNGELGMQRKGRSDGETPKIQPHRKTRPQDTVPWEEITSLEQVCMSSAPVPALFIYLLKSIYLVTACQYRKQEMWV